MDTTVTAAKAGETAGAQRPQEVSTPENTAPKASEANPAPKEKAEDDASKVGETQEKGEERRPFHEDPVFNRLNRRTRRNEALIREQSETISSLKAGIEELLALQKGADYKPAEKTSEGPIDFEALMDSEMEILAEKEGLTPQEEAIVMEISKEHAIIGSDGESVPLPLENAFKIYLKYQKSQVKNETPKQEPKKEEVKPTSKEPPASKNGVPAGFVTKRPMHVIIEEAKAQMRK